MRTVPVTFDAIKRMLDLSDPIKSVTVDHTRNIVYFTYDSKYPCTAEGGTHEQDEMILLKNVTKAVVWADEAGPIDV